MIVVVQGTKEFNGYNIFLRGMGVAMSGMKDSDKEFIIYTLGPIKINSMVIEFCNLSERGMKSRGMKIKNYKVSPDWVLENMEYVNYFAFFSGPKQQISKIVAEAELKNIEVGIFRY